MTAKESTLKSERPKNGRVFYPLEKINGPVPKLEIADIVLVRHKRFFMRWLLRKITNSYWDHACMIIFTRNPEKGYSNDILIEAIQYELRNAFRRGVEVHRFEKYLKNPKKYDIGIKRFTWLDEEMKNRVRAFMLMNVDTPYYPLYTTKFLLAWISGPIRRYLLKRQRFSCSGLVQKAFYEASDWETRDSVIFRGQGYTPIEIQEVTSPADIANSELCEWVYNKH